MHVKVKNRLPAVVVCIYYDAISVLSEASISRDLARSEQEVPERSPITVFGLSN
jgi:hypothetical protein